MAPRIQPVAERFPALEEQEVVLAFFAPEARVVQVAGSFNHWQPAAGPLMRQDGGEWAIRLLLEAGQYEYRFVVDGAWTDDPRATQFTANPHGGLNAVLRVGFDDRTEFL
jgi:1,4-alpha-glucan branching enzyme